MSFTLEDLCDKILLHYDFIAHTNLLYNIIDYYTLKELKSRGFSALCLYYYKSFIGLAKIISLPGEVLLCILQALRL